MEKFITRTMSAFCLSLLLFYAYAFATIQRAPMWTPPIVGRCIVDLAGDIWCW